MIRKHTRFFKRFKFIKVSISSNLLRLVLWPSIWSILENILCMLENYAYSAAVGCSVPWMPIGSRLFTLLFKSSISLLIFWLTVLSIFENWHWSVQILLISPFNSVSFSFMSFGILVRWIYVYNCYIYLLDWLSYYYGIFLVSNTF